MCYGLICMPYRYGLQVETIANFAEQSTYIWVHSVWTVTQHRNGSKIKQLTWK